jgi:hypothetical protein
MIWLAGWWRRDLWCGAFAWGFAGAWLGQIHMSGFFLAFGLLLCTLLLRSSDVPRVRVRWGAWFFGSVLGALPLIPWAWYWWQHPVHETIARGWEEVLQLKFWVFWITNPLGLTLGNPLGLLRGQSNWTQISDFVRYPLIQGQATYLCGLAHVSAVTAALAILLPGGLRAVKRIGLPSEWLAQRGDLRIVLFAGIWAFGLLLTASSIVIRRYYLMVSFPLEFVWLTHLALARPVAGRRRLALLWVSQLFISACFVGYVHVNKGATQGDYGDAFHVVMEKRAAGH